jgi:hypothetical protein
VEETQDQEEEIPDVDDEIDKIIESLNEKGKDN